MKELLQFRKMRVKPRGKRIYDFIGNLRSATNDQLKEWK